ncbi:hypothetical protein RRF57_001087 [Xylaria bambusicola]|uniref:Uncharacterized protein n=1 Tax=Xylaria bambusicola TaxID=326684 RepID=A0AAN7Z5Y7_9PEZI
MNFNEAKHDFDAMSKLKQDLEASLSEDKQADPIECQVLREKVADSDVKIKYHMGEIKQLREVTENLNDIVRNSKKNIERCEREIMEYKGKLEDAPRQIQELRESHHTTVSLLKEDFVKQKCLLEEDHRAQIGVERKKLERLEQLIKSLSNSKRQQTEQHCKALEDTT